MVKLNIALHGGIDRPAGHDDDDELVQATNLWFDAEVDAHDLLDAIDGGCVAMSELFSICYEEAQRFYRIWDSYQPGEHWEDVTDSEDEFTPDAPLGYHEWHADVDWDNGRHFTILGTGFGEEMASPELITYLQECAS